MPLREVLQSLGNFGKELDVMVLDDAGEAEDLFVKLCSDRHGAQALESIDQCVGETLQSVSVLHDAFALDLVEDFPHLLGGELVMVEE